jgi:hypothetical protein
MPNQRPASVRQRRQGQAPRSDDLMLETGGVTMGKV